ncbi:hypothetical protein FNV43_RR09362 [Rhamnella rubrinervis]|uniref:C2 domain-containing protein n=1 Tax=Rhamnella rubrinervis TaxID=2594499 RepID=A0A8K0HB44_9ROSA|nr:hypothetical protein FNV43_RR09362 [Rhamnella rubrinervis]
MNVNQNSSTMSVLLEIHLVSAQELKLPRMAKKRMKTYAIAWVDPDEKLKSSIDKSGRNNPTWNDKFTFTVERDVLERLTSCLEIEIYRVRRFLKDKLIGRTRVLLCNLVNCSNRYQEGQMRGTFRAFQVRLPNSEPYGILNLRFNILQGLPCQIMTQFLRTRKLSFQHKRLTSFDTSGRDPDHHERHHHAIKDDTTTCGNKAQRERHRLINGAW